MSISSIRLSLPTQLMFGFTDMYCITKYTPKKQATMYIYMANLYMLEGPGKQTSLHIFCLRLHIQVYGIEAIEAGSNYLLVGIIVSDA